MRYVVIISLFVFSLQARAGVQNFTDEQRPQWFDAVALLGEYDTIDFTGFSNGTFITTQYQQDFGVTFSGGVTHFSPSAYPNDSFGLFSNPIMTIFFDEPQNWFAVDHPGITQFMLYRDGELLHTTPPSAYFVGVTMSKFFDEVVLFDPGDSVVAIDDIYFGTVPTPASILTLLFAFCRRNQQRRRYHSQY